MSTAKEYENETHTHTQTICWMHIINKDMIEAKEGENNHIHDNKDKQLKQSNIDQLSYYLCNIPSSCFI